MSSVPEFFQHFHRVVRLFEILQFLQAEDFQPEAYFAVVVGQIGAVDQPLDVAPRVGGDPREGGREVEGGGEDGGLVLVPPRKLAGDLRSEPREGEAQDVVGGGLVDHDGVDDGLVLLLGRLDEDVAAAPGTGLDGVKPAGGTGLNSQLPGY